VLGIFPGSLFGKKDEVTVITDEACVKINEKTSEIIQLRLPEGQIDVAESGTDSEGTVIYIIANVERDENGFEAATQLLPKIKKFYNWILHYLDIDETRKLIIYE